MKREQLIEKAWDEVKETIINCHVFQEEGVLLDSCESECDFYPICKRVIELENVEAI